MQNINENNTINVQSTEIETIKEDLSMLQDIIVDQICDDLIEKFVALNRNWLLDKLQKAKKYKNWIIIWHFLGKISSMTLTTLDHKNFLDELKEIYS